jgi:hypothetical protein
MPADMRVHLPAASPLAVAVVFAFATAAFAPEASAQTADDLPAGNEAPRLVPIAIVDTYWAYHDTPPASRQATLLTTAVRHNEFQINLAALGVRLEHAKLLGTLVLQAGTSVDALYPPAAGSAQNNPEVWKHIQVASVGYRIHSDVTIEAGVMPSHLGNEGFVSTGNWNYTRAMIAEATPYFVSGVKATWRVAPTFTLTGLFYNGWNVYYDVRGSKSGGLKIEWKPTDKFSIASGGHVGPGAEGSTSVRVYDDVTAKLNLHARLDVALQLSAGMDKTKGFDAMKVYGAAAWLRWFLGETTYVAVRGEYLSDETGIFTGQGARPSTPFGAPVLPGPSGQKTMLAGTLTLGWLPHPSFLARVEVLQRSADVEYFAGGGPQAGSDKLDGAQKRSTTVAASLAFSY